MTAWNDDRLKLLLGTLLKTGVILAAVIVLLGGVCCLARHGSEPAAYSVFHGAAEQYRSVHGVLQSAGPWDCGAVIQLGLLLLIATPVARVVLSLTLFSLVRDYTYAAFTAVVLAVLIYGLAGPH
jgi:uncharacterized membrane protein